MSYIKYNLLVAKLANAFPLFKKQLLHFKTCVECMSVLSNIFAALKARNKPVPLNHIKSSVKHMLKIYKKFSKLYSMF